MRNTEILFVVLGAAITKYQYKLYIQVQKQSHNNFWEYKAVSLFVL